MTALTATRSVQRFGDPVQNPQFNFPIKAATKCFQGGIAVLDAGYIAPGRTATGLIAIGIFDDQAPLGIDNTSGSAGALTAGIRRGAFPFVNSAAADAIAQANVGQLCYIVDDQTVALTDGNGTRSPAGIILQVDSAGVWVEIGGIFPASLLPSPSMILTVPVTLAGLVVGGGTFAQLGALGFAGRIKSVAYVPAVAGAGAGATFACNAQIAGVSTTGGVATITLANTGFGAAPVAGTPITAANTFTAAQAITLVNAAGTVFTGGSGAFLITLG
jgi:hypothetical protein